MTLNRKAFKSTSMSVLQEQQNAVEKATGSKKKRADYLELEEGPNKVRIYPAHPDTKTGSFCFPRTIHFLDTEVTYEKDGKEVTEIKRKPIFNSRIHGQTEKDIIDEYISYAHKIAYEEIQDDKERTKFLKPILDFKTGLKSQTRWIVYADIHKGSKVEFGRLDLPTSVKDDMNKIASASDSVDSPPSTDPFTDPDEGRAIQVIKDLQNDKDRKDRDPKKYYVTSLLWQNPEPLTDQQLEKFMEQKPLEEIFHLSYTRKDFELALDGLRRFDSEMRDLGGDEKESYGFMEQEDFIATVEEIDAYYPEIKTDEDEIAEYFDDEKNSKSEKKSKKLDEDKKTAPKKTKEASDDLPWDTPLEDMDRTELKGVIRREKLGIKVFKNESEQDIVEKIKEARAEAQEEEIEEEEEEIEETPRRRRRGGGNQDRLAQLEEE